LHSLTTPEKAPLVNKPFKTLRVNRTMHGKVFIKKRGRWHNSWFSYELTEIQNAWDGVLQEPNAKFGVPVNGATSTRPLDVLILLRFSL
jgi:hypothetical protein